MLTKDIKRAGEPKLADLVLAYFRENADETLQALDIAVKFDVEISQVPQGLKWHVAHDFIRRTGDSYSAGPALLEQIRVQSLPTPAAAAPVASASAEAQTQQATTVPAVEPPARLRGAAKSRVLPALDLKAIAIRSGVPLPAQRTGGSRYTVLFERMKAGDMVELPETYRGAITKAVKVHMKSAPKQKFQMRRLAGEKFGLWRTA